MAVGVYKVEQKDSGSWIVTFLTETTRMSSQLSERFESEEKAVKFVDKACPGYQRLNTKEFDRRHRDTIR